MPSEMRRRDWVLRTNRIMMNFLLSLKTTVWTLLALICVFFLGSYMMPMHRNVFGAMNDRLLIDWARNVASLHPLETSWFFLSVAGLALLAANTIVCSVQAIRGRWSRRDTLKRVAPQVVHIGFLCILLAHLVGAVSGYRLSGTVPEGATVGLPENRSLHLRSVRIDIDRAGYPRNWHADIEVLEQGRSVAAGTLGPNTPLFYRGIGFYLKSFDVGPTPLAVLMVNKDPGVLWALAGAILFVAGSVAVLLLKLQKI